MEESKTVRVRLDGRQAKRLERLSRRFGLPAPDVIRLLIRDAGRKLEVHPEEDGWKRSDGAR